MAIARGGAILNEGTLTLNAVTVTGNSARGAGGGVYSNGSLTVEGGSQITFNQASGVDWYGWLPYRFGGGGGSAYGPARGMGEGGWGGWGRGWYRPASPGLGGGVYVAGGTAALTNVTLASNIAVGGRSPYVGAGSYGGAVYVAAGTVVLSDATLSSNIARGGPGRATGLSRGGAVFVGAGTVTLRNDAISGNSARAGGGVSIAAAATVSVDTLTLNHAEGNKPDNLCGPYTVVA